MSAAARTIMVCQFDLRYTPESGMHAIPFGLPTPRESSFVPAMRKLLRTAGTAEADLARIAAPIGLPIHAQSPAEIAVAILAQVIEALRTRGMERTGAAA